MSYILEAACLCNKGKVRKNNEDNFFFNKEYLDAMNDGLEAPLSLRKDLRENIFLAVFDGMGGENFGELASYAAADCMKDIAFEAGSDFVSEGKFLNDICLKANDAVVARQKKLLTDRMGSTLVGLYFSNNDVYACNLGDSRAYRYRAGELLQISVDHVAKNGNYKSKKAPLTQHLGIDPDNYILEPYIAKGGQKLGDQYLLCSDGLTDMLTDQEISEIMEKTGSAEECVRCLVDAALEKGGRDNTTVIVARLKENPLEVKSAKEDSQLEKKKSGFSGLAKRLTSGIIQTSDKGKSKNSLKKTTIMICAITAAVCIAFGILLFTTILPGTRYKKALVLMESEKYEEAYKAFIQLGNYKDSPEKADECGEELRKATDYEKAIALMESGDYQNAADLFASLGEYKDSAKKSSLCNIIVEVMNAAKERLIQSIIPGK